MCYIYPYHPLSGNDLFLSAKAMRSGEDLRPTMDIHRLRRIYNNNTVKPLIVFRCEHKDLEWKFIKKNTKILSIHPNIRRVYSQRRIGKLWVLNISDYKIRMQVDVTSHQRYCRQPTSWPGRSVHTIGYAIVSGRKFESWVLCCDQERKNTRRKFFGV